MWLSLWRRLSFPAALLACPLTLFGLAGIGLGIRFPCNRAAGTHSHDVIVSEQPCQMLESLGAFKQIKDDISRYRNLSANALNLAHRFCALHRRACVTLRIVCGHPFVVDLFPGYQSRHKATLQGVLRALNRFGPVPDLQVVIDVTDGELQNIDLPVLVITHKVHAPAGILYPDFTFFSWPESTCPPSEPSHAHKLLFHWFVHNWTLAANPWAFRRDVLFWRGARVLDEGVREKAISIFANQPGTDVRFMSWQGVSVTGRNSAIGCVGFLRQCQNRYLAFLRGTTYSSRLKYQLLCGSTVLAAQPNFVEWWTRLLAPGVHYANVSQDWSDADSVLAALRREPAKAQLIAEHGQRLAFSLLSSTAADCYWQKLLVSLAPLLPPPSQELPARARPLEDVLLWPDDVGITEAASGPQGGPEPRPV